MAAQENDSTDIEVVLKDLKKINKGAITELKSLSHPPQLVKKVMEAVCIFLGRTPSWEQSRKLLGNVNEFLQQIQAYDKDNIPPEVITKIRNDYTSDPDFSIEKAKTVSMAVWKLCSWVIAMEKYDKAVKSADGKKPYRPKCMNKKSQELINLYVYNLNKQKN